MFVTVIAPRSRNNGRTAGVAYLILTVHVALEARGDAAVQVCPVMLYRPPKLRVRVSAVINSGPVPVLVMVTTLVTGARGVGIVNVNTRTPKKETRVPLVAEVKVSTPS